MTKLRKILVRDEKLWKAGITFLTLPLVLLVVGIITKRLIYALPNVFIALAFLILSTRFRAVRLDCNGKMFLLIPDYSTSTLILRDSKGKVLSKTFFPLFEEEKLETPCGTLEVHAIRHRFGKVKLRIKLGNEEITLP
ncbi:hypothetical protein [Thermococcus sp.]|uniref:hypothetical protein n=1 Tax=Thermococcus sp. TaxID=35749 RepID=UPI0026385331|nr:hypothetical protein [Thermococcus sp.]